MSSGQWEGGKGSNQRKAGNQKQFDNNWDAIFGKKNKASDNKAEPDNEKHNSVSKKPS